MCLAEPETQPAHPTQTADTSRVTVHRHLMSPGHRKNALLTATLLGVP